MIIDANGKCPFEIRDSTGKEFKKIYAADGNLLFKNWNTIQGTPPIVFKGYNKTLKNYKIYGNTIQDGTPTPENPVEVQGVGEYDAELNGYKIPVTVAGQPNALFTESIDEVNKKGVAWSIKNGFVTAVGTASGQSNPIEFMVNRAGMSGDFCININTDKERVSVGCRIIKNGKESYQSHKDTIHLDGTEREVKFYPQVQAGTYNVTFFPTIQRLITISVYVGSEPLHKIADYADYIDFERGVVVRNIKKIVLTGDENWRDETHNENQNVYKLKNFINFRKFPKPDDAGVTIGIYRCDHILYVQYPYPSSLYDRIVLLNDYYDYPYTIFFSTKKSMGFDTLQKFKNFLAEQYALGQPVTIWYIAAEPEEEPLGNLLPIQTIKGTNALSTNATVQPSEIYLRGKIKSLATHMLVDSSGNILLTSNNCQLVTKEE